MVKRKKEICLMDENLVCRGVLSLSKYQVLCVDVFYEVIGQQKYLNLGFRGVYSVLNWRQKIFYKCLRFNLFDKEKSFSKDKIKELEYSKIFLI